MDSSRLELRVATADDLPALARMNQHLIQDEGSRNPMRLPQLEERMTRFLRQGWTAALVSIEGVAVGYALFRERPDEYGPDRPQIYVRQFFIEREHRRRGVGQQAFNQIAQTLFPPGVRVVIEVLESNAGGRRFWERIGFVPYCTAMHRQSRPEEHDRRLPAGAGSGN